MRDARLTGLHPDWRIDGEYMCREWLLDDFCSALALTNHIGELAQRLNHHPEITLSWGRVAVRCTTHDAGRLTPLDLQLAAALDALAKW